MNVNRKLESKGRRNNEKSGEIGVGLFRSRWAYLGPTLLGPVQYDPAFSQWPGGKPYSLLFRCNGKLLEDIPTPTNRLLFTHPLSVGETPLQKLRRRLDMAADLDLSKILE